MAVILSDLSYGDLWSQDGVWLGVGNAAGAIWLEIASGLAMEMEEILPGTGEYRKRICTASESARATVCLGPDRIPRIAVEQGGSIGLYVVPDLGQPAEFLGNV